MSDAFLVKNARMQFVAATEEMFDVIGTSFAECENTKDVQLFFQNVTKASDAKLTTAIDEYYNHLMTPLDSKKTKYAKAVERLTGSAVVQHAIQYRDLDALKHNMNSDVATKMALFDKMGEARLEETTKTELWKLLDMISASTYAAKQEKMPILPTREEIQENIKAHRKSSSQPADSSSMLRAFHTDYNALCKLVGASPLPEDGNTSEVQKYMERWAAFASGQADDGDTMNAACTKRSASAAAGLRVAFPELSLTDEALSEAAWIIIVRLNSVSAVVNNIPTNMMTQIESVANQLARDLQNGTIDMSSINLSQLGEQVLSNCSDVDMNNFAGNIDKLMPIVQTMAGQQK